MVRKRLSRTLLRFRSLLLQMMKCRELFLLCVAIQLLKDKPAGSFVVRNSSSFQGSFGLAVKVSHLPANVQVKGGLYFIQ